MTPSLGSSCPFEAIPQVVSDSRYTPPSGAHVQTEGHNFRPEVMLTLRSNEVLQHQDLYLGNPTQVSVIRQERGRTVLQAGGDLQGIRGTEAMSRPQLGCPPCD
jgi:hypothetical protein